jgi:hypothetical protein
MELAGNEKRIQALFSELSLQDQSCAPRFETLWTRATAPAPVRGVSGFAMAIAATFVIAAACSLGVWSWYRSSRSPVERAHGVEPPAISTPLVHEAGNPAPAVRPVTSNRRPRQKKLTRPRQTERAIMREAAMLASWQSPTQRFIQSPTGSVFNSLPQLNQSAEDLKLFLPKNDQLIKESNQ